MNINQVGNLLSGTAIVTGAIGLAEYARVTVSPVVAPVFAFGPPIDPAEFEKWFPVLSSLATFSVGIWTMIANKVRAGVRSEVAALRQKLDEHIDDATVSQRDIRADMRLLTKAVDNVAVAVTEHEKTLDEIRQREKGRSRVLRINKPDDGAES